MVYFLPRDVSDVLYEIHSNEVIELDKRWQAIHFMLTGEEYEGLPPLSAEKKPFFLTATHTS